MEVLVQRHKVPSPESAYRIVHMWERSVAPTFRPGTPSLNRAIACTPRGVAAASYLYIRTAMSWNAKAVTQRSPDGQRLIISLSVALTHPKIPLAFHDPYTALLSNQSDQALRHVLDLVILMQLLDMLLDNRLRFFEDGDLRFGIECGE